MDESRRVKQLVYCLFQFVTGSQLIDSHQHWFADHLAFNVAGKILDFLNQLTAVATWPRDSFCLKPSYDPGLPWVFWLLFICMAYLLICTGGEVALKKNSCRTLFLVETGPIMYAACCLARLPLWSRFLIEFPEVGLLILPLTIIWLLLPLIEVFTGFEEPSRWRMSLTIY